MKRYVFAVAVVISGLMLVGCGSSDSNASKESTETSASGSAVDSSSTTKATVPKANPADLKSYLNKLFTMRANDQQGPAWDLLVPQQQALIPRTKFLTCGEMPVALTDVSVSIVGDPYEEETTIPGVAGTVPSTAVTVRLTANFRGKETTENLTVHVVDVNGEWRWILSEDNVDECA
jgi:hypothetical protein